MQQFDIIIAQKINLIEGFRLQMIRDVASDLEVSRAHSMDPLAYIDEAEKIVNKLFVQVASTGD